MMVYKKVQFMIEFALSAYISFSVADAKRHVAGRMAVSWGLRKGTSIILTQWHRERSSSVNRDC